MKRTITTTWMAAALILLGVGAFAQSLGDYARSVRKNKPETNTVSHHYDNDNLPTDQQISVVGPPPSETAAAPAKSAAAAAPADANKSARQKADDELQKKIEDQKKKLDSLSQDLEVGRREYQMHMVALITDTSNHPRDASQIASDDAQYKSDIESKQKAVDAARQQLDELQEQAHRAGITPKDEAASKDNAPDTTKDDGSKK